VERIAPIVDAQRGSFTVRLALERSEPDLLPESSVSVQVILGEIAGAILLEQRFIVREGGGAFVFVAEDGRAKRIPVTVRDLGNGLYDCRPGLDEGRIVLLPQGLKDGLKVKPARAAE
jgi:multidrug efflux pump subunit AcrA (membrane-fusion protein)